MRKIILPIFITLLSLKGNAQPGTLDKSFGTNGFVKTVLNGNGNTLLAYAKNCFIQGDGKMLVIVELNATVVINRRLANGNIDSSYGTNGFSVPVNINQPVGAIQNDGKIVIAGSTINTNSDFILARYNTNGTLDASFGIGGVSITDAGSTSDVPNAVAIEGNGKIIAGGQSYVGGISQFALIQYNSNGVPDPFFGTNGVVITNFGNSCNINSIAIQTDNKIIAAGNYFNGSANDFAIARYKTNGSLDLSFNTTGLVTSNFGYSDNATAVAIQSNGKIVVGGYFTDASSNNHFEVARYNANGSTDLSFNNSGLLTTTFGYPEEYLTAIGIQKNGKIVAGGYTNDNNGVQDYALVRINNNGLIDSSFGINSQVKTSITSTDVLNFLVLPNDGNIIAGGNSYTGSTYEFTLVQYENDGSLSTAFGSDGKLLGYYPDKDLSYLDVLIQKDGKLLTDAQTNDGTNFGNLLYRFNSNGTKDLTYGQKGSAVTSGVYSVMQSDNKVVEAGFQNSMNGGEIVMTRYKTNGSIDSTYGTNGSTISDFFGGNEYEGPAVIQKDDKVIVVGYIYNNVGSDLLIARYNTDGTPDESFGNGGAVVSDIQPYDFAQSVAIGPDGKLVVGGYGFNASFQIVMTVSRYNINGSPDSTFGQNGSFTIAAGVQAFTGSVAIQNNGKILLDEQVSYDYSTYTNYLSRYKLNGTLDSSFGQNGTIITTPGSTIILENDQKIIANGYVINQQNNRDVSLSRYNTNGTPDLSFGKGGTTITSFTPGDDVVGSMAISGSQLFAAGYADDPNPVGILAKYLVPSPTVAFVAPANIIIPTDHNSCAAIVKNNLSPNSIAPGTENTFSYALEGVTQGKGIGSVTGLSFNKGVTNVSYTLAEDSTQSGTFTVTVLDKEAPVISDVTTSVTNTNSDAQFADVLVNYIVTDNCAVVTNSLSVSSDGVINSGNAQTSADWQILDNHHVRLNKENLPGGMERNYTIKIASSDSSGNQSFKNIGIVLPGNALSDFIITATPNPSRNSFSLAYKAEGSAGTANLKLYNAQGSLLQEINNVFPGQTIHIGNSLVSGVYYLSATKAGTVKTIKLLKL